MGEDKVWLLTYFPVAWTAHICQGLCMGIFGPTQPYLAQNVGVPNQQINLIWTVRAFGSCFATVMTGFIFKEYIKQRSHKLLFLALCIFFTGFFIVFVPWTSSFGILLTSKYPNCETYVFFVAILLAGIFFGSLSTASNSLVLFMLGPDRSPPFLQSLHAFVALGFVLGSLIVRPFLPAKEENLSVCNEIEPQGYSNVSQDKTMVVDQEFSVEDVNAIVDAHIPNIVWPFLIIAVVNFVTALGFLCLILGRIPMPRFYESIVQDDETIPIPNSKKEVENTKHTKSTLLLAFFYSAFSCGLEGFFQSQTFTFGICGPHKMEPEMAASLTTVYFASFLAGRFFGVLLSTKLRPQTMILASLICCILSAILLVFTASSHQWLLFIGTGAIGFFVSLQFASGYSWLAEYVDLTGRASSVVFLGANIGWLVFPPLAGMVFFSSVGPMGVYYLTLGLSFAHLLLFITMLKVSSIKC